jgi:hypothetical protein
VPMASAIFALAPTLSLKHASAKLVVSLPRVAYSWKLDTAGERVVLRVDAAAHDRLLELLIVPTQRPPGMVPPEPYSYTGGRSAAFR